MHSYRNENYDNVGAFDNGFPYLISAEMASEVTGVSANRIRGFAKSEGAPCVWIDDNPDPRFYLEDLAAWLWINKISIQSGIDHAVITVYADGKAVDWKDLSPERSVYEIESVRKPGGNI